MFKEYPISLVPQQSDGNGLQQDQNQFGGGQTIVDKVGIFHILFI